MQTGFQAFQHAFARHLRDPARVPPPPGVPARRAAVYSELLFNNFCGFLDRCFPVCRRLLGEPRWRRLSRAFYRDWPLHTPWFREIPREFVRYLAQAEGRPPLPRWFCELAHYEWAELAVDTMDAIAAPHDSKGNLLTGRVVLNPALLSLAYAWPVHRIGPSYRPRKASATHLLVFRDTEEAVQFCEINPVTARLVALLAAAPTTGETACRRVAAELRHAEPQRIVDTGALLLDDLRRQGVILGVLA